MISNIMCNRKSRIFILLIYLLVYWLTFIPRANNPIRGYGDYSSHAATIISVRNFNNYGITKLYGLGVHTPIIDIKDTGKYSFYTHYPPSGQWVCALLSKIGLDEIRYFRLFAAMASCFSLLFLYLLIARTTNDYLLAFLTLLFTSISPFYYPYADSFFQAPFLNFLLFGTLLSFVYALHADSKIFISYLWYPFVWFLMFLQCWFSYEGVAFCMIFIFIYGKYIAGISFRKILVWLILLFSAVFIFILVHRLLISFALGSFSLSVNDFLAAFSGEARSTIPRFCIMKMFYWLFSPVNIFTYLLILISSVYMYISFRRGNKHKLMSTVPFLITALIVAAIPWCVVFRYHFANETSKDFRHFIAGLSLAVAWIVLLAARKCNNKRISVLIFITFISLSLFETYDIVTPALKPKWEFLNKLDNSLEPDSLLITNVTSFPSIAYSNRPNIKGIKSICELNSMLEKEKDYCKQYSNVYVVVFLNNCIDSPVKANILESAGLRYLGCLKNIFPFNYIKKKSITIRDKEISLRNDFLKQIKNDIRFKFIMSIPESEAYVFQIVIK